MILKKKVWWDEWTEYCAFFDDLGLGKGRYRLASHMLMGRRLTSAQLPVISEREQARRNGLEEAVEHWAGRGSGAVRTAKSSCPESL